MDFQRGRQVFIHDLRVLAPGSNLSGPPSAEVWWLSVRAVAPKAWFNLEVDYKKDLVSSVFATVATRARVARREFGKELDALHIMAHGYEGAVELGTDWLHRPTMQVLSKISGLFRYVVFHSCLVGKVPQNAPAFMSSTSYGGSQFARKVAALTTANVVVAREVQKYNMKKLADATKGELDLGNWEGPVDIYRDGAAVQTHNGPLDDPFDLEAMIFGAKKK